jgi:hypothetical protein
MATTLRTFANFATLSALLIAVGGCEKREVIKRVKLTGYEPAEVVFVKLSNGSDTTFRVEYPNGAYTKVWLDSKTVTAEQIRDECRVEYDGATLRVIGPGEHRLEVPGFRLPKAP